MAELGDKDKESSLVSREGLGDQAVPADSEGAQTLSPIFIKILPERIVYLKSILESYDELGIVRTLNRARGEIVLLTIEANKAELLELLAALKSEVDFEIIEYPSSNPPEGVDSEDWLLGEIL